MEFIYKIKMESINNYFTTNTFTIQSLIKYIYQNMPNKSYNHRLHYKKYESDNLIQLFTELSQEHTNWDIYNACRSIIFENTTGKIVTYSHPILEYLQYDDALQYFNMNTKFTESHEGTLITVFFYNNRWYYSTRRHIDMYQTNKYVYGVKSELSHGEMFEEALNKIGMTKNEFESKLDNTLQYYFELVHYQNSFNITYEDTFGEKYAKLFLLFIKNENNELVDKTNISKLLNVEINQELSLDEVKTKLSSKEKIEGFIFERIGTNGDKKICKVLHPDYYSILKYSPGFKTIQEQYIYLYQKNLLNEYVNLNNKVVYTTIDNNNIEVIGLVSAFFTHTSQRLLDIYYKFNNNNMVHRNEELFKKIFMDEKKYPLIFYTLGKMKGIHMNKQINLNEMRKMLKYNMTTSDIWKLSNEIIKLESVEVGLLHELSNKLVKCFY